MRQFFTRTMGAAAIVALTLGFSFLPPASTTAIAATTTPAPAGTYQETSPAIAFTGSWTSLASSGSSGGAIKYSAASTASATLTFVGPDITWYTWQSPSAGKVNVFIDGTLRTTVDNYASSSKTRVRAFTARDLGGGSHTITIKSAGSKNSASSGVMTHFDSFVVGEAQAAAPTQTAVSEANCPAATTRVTNAAGLKSALEGAKPGTVIQLAPGTYRQMYATGFTLSASGTAQQPIWICGPRSAIVQGMSPSSGAALRLNGSDHVRLVGFTVNNALQGVMVKGGSKVLISELNVKDVGYEAIHLYGFTTDSYVMNNRIERTGAIDVAFGEGIYIGTSQRRWAEVTGGQADRSDRNIITGNTIITAGAEGIEAKEGTSGGAIYGNTITGHQPGSRAEAWILVTGNNWTVSANTGQNAVTNGFASMSWSTEGTNNRFHDNTGTVNASGYGVWVHQPASGTSVGCDNYTTGAAGGQTNIFCTP